MLKKAYAPKSFAVKGAKYIRRVYYSEHVLTVEWIAVALLSVIGLCSFIYMDLRSLTVWSVNLLDTTYEGRLLEFYSYSAENIYNLHHQYVGCEIWGLIPWAVWNIPIWIAQRFFGVVILDSPIMMLWSKLFLSSTLSLASWLVYKIGMIITGDKNKALWAVILTASSVFTFTAIYVAGQNDIVWLIYGLAAVYWLLKEKTARFIFFSACAIAAKPFFLFPFIALVLLYEKNVIKIIGKTVLSLGIWSFFKIMYNGAPLYEQSLGSGVSKRVTGNMLSKAFPVSYGGASIFITGLLILYIIAYIQNLRTEKEKHQFVIYITAASFILFVLFSSSEFYRAIIVVPFLALLTVQNRKMFRLNLLLDLFMSVSCTYIKEMNSALAYTSANITGTVTEKFISFFGGITDPGQRKFISLKDIYAHPKLEFLRLLEPAAAAVFLACGLMLIILNYPNLRIKNVGQIEYEKSGRWILWARILSPLPFVLAVFVCWFWIK